MIKFTVLTLFPEMFAPIQESILKRAQAADLIQIKLVNFRDYAVSKHKNVDDVPYGGGPGMVLKPEPIYAAVRDLTGLQELRQTQSGRKIVLLTPQGRLFNQSLAWELSALDEIVLICGHYEGFDERIRDLADEEVSIGDFVLTGGELGAMVVMDAVSRLIPGVLGESGSCADDSHSQGVLEYPQYTRPPEFEGKPVPEVLVSGHHGNIERWRRKEALRRTFTRRLDLIPALEFLPDDYPLLEELAAEIPEIGAWRGKWEHLRPPKKKRRFLQNPSSREES
ncbi:MAG: tRNA (guanosine(37)-N1)-methyltransferase TrmD [Desulfitobacteriaceae bacterium]